MRSAARSAVAAFVASMLTAGLALAGGFELDGNPGQGASTSLEDWETLYDGGAETGGSSVAYSGVVADPSPTTIFRGSAKDIQDVTQWRWKSGGVPDKDDITNAYAAAYIDGGDLVIYFGADRFANTGDAFLGFWFFKDHVTMEPDGTFGGTHQAGDVLVLVNYDQGSGPEIQVIEWNPALDDVGTNLHLIYSGPGALCGSVPPAAACAITNGGDLAAPWPYTPKDGTAGVFPYETFFEGGINLTQIIGSTSCFSSFMAETRSSTSVSATLKDFVIGDFPVCGAAVEKTCMVARLTDGDDPTDRFYAVEFSGAVTNTGAGTFPAGSLVTVVDDAGTPAEASDDVVIAGALPAPLPPGGSHPFAGTFYSDDNPPMNTIRATVETIDALVTAESFSVECEPLPLSPDLDLSKMCWLSLETVGGVLAVQVNFSGDVTNTGDVPLLVTVDDDMAGTVLAATVLLPGETAMFGGSYLPSSANGGETDPSCANFTSAVTATGTSPLLLEPVSATTTSTCPLCPSGGCD